MERVTLPQLSELEALRGNRVIVYASAITDDGVGILYECLRRRGRAERLDLVLSTPGGLVTTTRQMALLLREYARHLSILVPHRAKSSGTLLCLSANELVLGPMAELGPIDSQIGAAGPPPPDTPGAISAEDIRAFPRMAEDWFGVNREEDRLQVLALVAQRIFPTSLSSFYRFDRLVRQIANELLAYQLGDAEADSRRRIVDQLVGGYDAHDYILTRGDARQLGLRVHDASPREESLLWDLLQACRERMDEPPDQRRDAAGHKVIGLIVDAEFSARQVHRRIAVPSSAGDGSRRADTPRADTIVDTRWEIDA